MYNEYPKITNAYEKEYFDAILSDISQRMAKKEAEGFERQASYAESYKQEMLDLIARTPAVYYQALRLAFDQKKPVDVREIINAKDMPIDLLASIDDQEPDAMRQFLQHVSETDVEVASVYDAEQFYSDTLLSIEISKALSEHEESISAEQLAHNLEITPTEVSKKIGSKAASCDVISRAIERVVEVKFGLDSFRAIDSDFADGKQLYDELIDRVAALPSACYGMIHAVADNRIIPAFYNARGKDYLDLSKDISLDNISPDEAFAFNLLNTLRDAESGVFSIYDVKSANEYYNFYSQNEIEAQKVIPSLETADKYASEQNARAEALAKLEAGERANAKKSADVRFNNYLSVLAKNSSIYKEDFNFLSDISKIYKKENALFESANEKYLKAELAVHKLRTIDDNRDLTPKESKALTKALEELSRAQARLEAVRTDLLQRSEERASANPKFSEHFEMRKEQLLSGDLTYIPLQTREDSINNKMYSYKAQLYASERDELLGEHHEAILIDEPKRAQINISLGSFTQQSTVKYEIDPSKPIILGSKEPAHEQQKDEAPSLED